MKTNLDALLTTLYVYLDDHVLPSREPVRRRGRPELLPDVELVCVAVALHLARATRPGTTGCD
uniref:hypothetical protein n=1 Tax=Actinomadura formosensis TaxID=60706 RepID=UPI00082BED33|nr:hypothetical protein [Actinomadura formosensis]